MPEGFVLIRVVPAHHQEVYNILSRVHGIIELHLLFGEYDLMAKIKADDFDEIADFVISKIQSIKGVIDTKTLNTT
jgi:DNA-binding Lrp family transcriptional regulator